MDGNENETFTVTSQSRNSDLSWVSADTYVQTDFVFEQIRISSLVFAVVVNVVNIIVYSRPKMKSPTSTYLTAASMAQTAYGVLFLLAPIASIFGRFDSKSLLDTISSFIIRNYLMMCLGRLMYVLTCLVSIERFLAVAFPLKAKQFRVTRSPLLFTSGAAVLIFISHVNIIIKFAIFPETVPGDIVTPTPLLHDTIITECQNIVDLRISESETEQSVSSRNVLITTFDLVSTTWQTTVLSPDLATLKTASSASKVVWTFGPSFLFTLNPVVFDIWAMITAITCVYGVLLVGVVMNVMLIVSLTRHGRQMRAITATARDDRKDRQVRQTTLTVLVANLVFVALSLPLVTNAFIGHVYPQYGYFGPHRYTFLYMLSLGTTFSCLSFCTDFLAFLALSSAYRSTLASLVGQTCSVFVPNRKDILRNKSSVGWQDNAKSQRPFSSVKEYTQES